MKKILLYSFGVLAFVLVGLAFSPLVSAKTTVVVATDSDTAPYTYKKDDQFAGYDIDVIKAIFKNSKDYKVEFETVPFTSILTGIDAGRYQIGANNFNYNKERAEKYLFSKAVSKSNYAVATPVGKKWTNLDDLSGKKTEVIAGSNYAQVLEKWNEANRDKEPIEIQYVSDKTSIVNRMQRIDNGAIDFILYDAISLEYLKKDQGFDIDVTKLEDKIGSKRDGLEYFVFSKDKKGKALRKFVNKRLLALSEDGTLKALSEKHFGGDFSPILTAK